MSDTHITTSDITADAEAFRRLVAEEVARINDLDADEVSVSPDDSLVDDLGLDSLGILELVLQVQNRYAVELPEDRVREAESVAQFWALLRERAAA
ncbi:acyl carrier protein [Tsukamurella sp. 1534]|uniref:acyl carrier protein n=1 Tax=Tsukamurella sp. 1534 TaxID=1151061 RepID=UPI0002DFD92B|nr:acyl carrier protein [Tsukamurella sp. 1534]